MAPVDSGRDRRYNHETLGEPRVPRNTKAPGVFAPLVGALVFKTSGGLEESLRWVQFPYTPAFYLYDKSQVK
jgi:hypothetical protein